MKVENGFDYKLILDQLPGAIVIDLTGKVVYLNNQCAEYINVNKEEAINKHIKEVFPETKMLENINIDEIKIVFYNSFGFGISVHVPIFKDGKRFGLLEYDVGQESMLMYDFANEYTRFLDGQLASLRKDIEQLRNTKYSIDNIIGESGVIIRMKEEIASAAKNNSTVVIFGETGTGKEMVAHSIHNLSRRFDKPFVKINSATIPENLVESELFGYEPGTFTGAMKDGKKGKFEIANKGTLFLDEINQMPMNAQPKLLRALQENEIEKIGGTESLPVDVRIIVTTNEDLRKLIKEGKFRADLFYRLHVVAIKVPPLRERQDDIPLLVDHFVKVYSNTSGKIISSVDKEVYRSLKQYNWPGNIRELQNVIERAVNNVEGNTITLSDIGMGVDVDLPFGMNEKHDNLIETAKNYAEKKVIIHALKKFDNNKSKAAEYLDIARPLLYKKMKRLGI